ncbi:MAG: histidinol-phosphatase HisJ family protein [Clostridiales bacterium]|nr:histidinol-phosphatase HisJ family protein [Clostridiales bacterium]
MIIADYHLHSAFSSDSEAPMEQMIDRAIQLGLKKLCFTDHMDYDYPVQKNSYTFIFEPEGYYRKLEELKEQYKDKIEILTGVELGLQPHLKSQVDALVQSYPHDFIIGSTHVVDHMDPYYPEYWMDKTAKEGIHRYYESIIESCKAIDCFHVYGHIDYIVRYVPEHLKKNFTYRYEDYSDILDEVLKTILSCGKGIEVNTSGYKYGLGRPHPEPKVLKRYRELGGELITIGSDAHKPEHLCYDFGVIPDLLKDIGFRYYAVFKQGKPIYEKL